MKYADLIVIGGGAAGFFTAINTALMNPTLKIFILEQSKETLNKVRVSGGGRCNATHACFDPKELISYYPRGSRELLGPFHVFGPLQTVEWFKNHDIDLKTEADGRMFPVTDNSETIIQCFLQLAKKLNIEIIVNVKVKNFKYNPTSEIRFEITTESYVFTCQKIMLATGSSPFIWNLLENQGYEIIAPVPSLFTFNLPKHPICALMGLSVAKVTVSIKNAKIKTQGPVLITHWGLSGPAVLKASAWGAVFMSENNYNFEVQLDWIPDVGDDTIQALRDTMAKKKVVTNPVFGVPSRLWQFLTESIPIDKEKNWASLSKKELTDIINNLKYFTCSVSGKTTFKEEFVTAGGVALHQLNFKTFESKIQPGLFMAGEVLNIDAVTGGFNFQAAWTGGYLAATQIAKIS
jgi:predicted Rossmann fold flavoprotein